MPNFIDGLFTVVGKVSDEELRTAVFTGAGEDLIREVANKPALWGATKSVRAAASFHHPQSVSDHRVWQEFIRATSTSATENITKLGSQYRRLANTMLEDADLAGERGAEFWRVAEGLQADSSGKLTFTYMSEFPEINEKVKFFRTQITDPLFKELSGLDPKVPRILEEKGLPVGGPKQEALLLDVIQIQRDFLTPGRKVARTRSALPENYQLAKELMGLIHYDGTQDLRIDHVNGYISHNPIDNEEAMLNEIKERLLKGTDVKDEELSSLWSESTASISKIDQRLATIKSIREQQGLRDLPNRDKIPGHTFGGHFSVEREKDAQMLFETDIAKLLEDYIHQAAHKRHMDVVQFHGRRAIGDLKVLRKDLGERTQSLEAQVQETINALRGVRSWREDLVLAEQVERLHNSIAKLPGFRNHMSERTFTVADISKYTSEIMFFQSVTRVMAPIVKFPLMNSTQVITSTYGVTGGEALLTGIKMARTREGWEMAKEAGVIGEDAQFFAEIKNVRSGLHRLIDKLQISKPALYTENANKVISYWAGRAHLLEKGRPTPLIKWLSYKKGQPITEADLVEYGRAMVKLTQFAFTSESKPLIFVGSSKRRLAGQFKTFSMSYASLYWNAVRYREWDVVARMTAAGLFFGGVRSVPVVGPILSGVNQLLKSRNLDAGSWYQDVRDHLKKHGINLPASPPTTGIGFLSSLGTPLGNIIGADIGEVPIDIVRSFEGLALPDPEHLDEFVLGPTFGAAKNLAIGAAGLGASILTGSKFRPEDMKKIGNAFLPSAVSVIEGLNELRHGGYYSGSGRLLVHRSTPHVIARMLNLQPSARSLRWAAMNDVKAAIASGSMKAIRRAIEQATSQGIYISDSDLSWAMGRVTSLERGSQF